MDIFSLGEVLSIIHVDTKLTIIKGEKIKHYDEKALSCDIAKDFNCNDIVLPIRVEEDRMVIELSLF